MAKSKKKTKKDEGQRVGPIKTLTEDLEKLKLTHASLVNRYKDLSKDYACATNSLTCVASLENENQVLKAQAEKLTSEFVTLKGIVGISSTQKNVNSTSAQNHHCSTSPWSILRYRIFRQGSTMDKEYRRIE